LTTIRTNTYAKAGLLIAGTAVAYYSYNNYRERHKKDQAESYIKKEAEKIKEKIINVVEHTPVGKK
jgi:uncharacterized membrane protein YebE (DUF533 family)